MDYYSQKMYIAQVDKNDTVLGKVERWEAHEKGILHRAFSVALFYQDQLILQHRKHPVFDDVFDVTFSSHQMYEGEKLQEDLTPIYSSLEREFFIGKADLTSEPELLGKVYYKAPDPRSKYIEHEICYYYSCGVKKLPSPNLDYAYGFSLRKIEDIKDKNNSLYSALPPWVLEGIKQKLI